MKIKALAAAGLLALTAATGASAAITGIGGSYAIIPDGDPALADITNGSPASNDDILAFNEQQGLDLVGSLSLDDVVINDRRISSHMILLNIADKEPNAPTRLSYSADFSFDGDILGVISTRRGLRLSAPVVGLVGTDYGDFRNIGLERNDGYTITSANTLNVDFRVRQPGDWIRVITVAPVPVPAGAVLLPTALIAMGAMRRRKAKATA